MPLAHSLPVLDLIFNVLKLLEIFNFVNLILEFAIVLLLFELLECGHSFLFELFLELGISFLSASDHASVFHIFYGGSKHEVHMHCDEDASKSNETVANNVAKFYIVDKVCEK